MISHGCSSIKYEYSLLNYFVRSLYLLPNSTLPNIEVQVTIWLFCKIDFSWLSNPLCQITESTVPNCQVHGAKSAFPSYQFHTTKVILPNCQVQICFVNCPQHKKFLGYPMSTFFQVCWNFCPKKSDPFIKLPSKLNFKILREIERFWVHTSYFLYIHFYEWCGFKSILME
jgi:hypothetical protein